METVILVLAHTPRWVFLLLALLVWLGVSALRPRTLPLRRVFATPAVFIAWGLLALAMAARTSPAIVAAWGLSAIAVGCLAFFATRLDGLRADRSRGIVELPGSILPLVRNLAIFVVKYALAATMARHPALHGELLPWDMAVSGAAFGYFAGWSCRFLVRWRRAAGAPAVVSGRSVP
jgi:hypothetical protein